MSIAIPQPARPAFEQPWLRGARWDLSFIILSVVVAALPYSVYVIFGGSALEAASIKGTSAYNARLLVNSVVALVVGGPHMYATFTRTVLDRDFRHRRRGFVAASALIPFAVVAMVVLSYQTYVWLLSIFFVAASLHALHQIVWLTDAYNGRARPALSWPSRLIDYAVVLTSLYPLAVYRMARGEFQIGPVKLLYTETLSGWYWLTYLAGLAFAVSAALFIGKSYAEHRAGRLNVPKTLLIAVAVALMFWTPLFPNLDTAFQGVNTWHSFQYIALTWYANRLREQATGREVGFLHWLRGLPSSAGEQARRAAGFVGALARLDRGAGWLSFYGLCLAMLPISGVILLGGGIVWPSLHAGQPGADEAYTYMGILAILLVHYTHDALLFTDQGAALLAPRR